MDIQSKIKKHEEAIELLERIEYYRRREFDLRHDLAFTLMGQQLGNDYFEPKIKACNRLIKYLEKKYEDLNQDENN